MEWEDKIQLVKLGNANKGEEAPRKAFDEYVLEKYKTFDNQSWEMFATLIEIIPSEMAKSSLLWETIYPTIKSLDLTYLGFREAIRLDLIIGFCEEILDTTIFRECGFCSWAGREKDLKSNGHCPSCNSPEIKNIENG